MKSMKSIGSILIGLALAAATAGAARADEDSRRSGYSYMRETAGEVIVVSRYNGRVEARRNLPISVGDEVVVSDGGRAEVGLADGNALFVGPGSRARFVSLADQQGEEDQFSAINLVEGSVVLSAGGDNADQIPRVDTEDATVYLEPGAAVRVNADPRRGTAVIARSGLAETRTRAGTFRVHAGEFLQVRGDEQPEIGRGVFSRDRFDIWVADRFETQTETRSASARYVDDRYASDAVALDGYGDWQYNDEYDTTVWSPRVESGWTPYSNGSWYYTPAGLTWWSYDPWGWSPFHYGTWFFSSSWSRWCWRPAFVYSPAWVYWAYTPSYVGWCPIGSYSYWSPWWNNYYRHNGWSNRSNVYIAINGVFSARTVDFRGWNFVGARGFGTAVPRMDVIPGARIADRLGTTRVAISSRPIVVNARPGEGREAVQGFVREAPRTIERTAGTDSARLAPILARERTLSPATLDAVRDRAVVAERGRLAGPGVADVAPRGAPVDRGRSLAEIAREPAAGIDRGRGTRVGAPALSRETRDVTERAGPPGAGAVPSQRAPVSIDGRGVARPEADWRSRPAPRPIERREVEGARPEVARPDRSETRPTERPAGRSIDRARPERGEAAPSTDWRSRPRGSGPAPEAGPSPRAPEASRGENWRSRSEVPPARRVVEGAVPGRRAPEAAPEETPRGRDFRGPDRDTAPRAREVRPEPAPAPRAERPHVDSPPPSRAERAPAYSAPPPPPRPQVEHRTRPDPEPGERGRRDR